MKVVHLNTTDFGGAAMAAIQIHEALMDQGVSSDLLTLTRTRTDIPRHHKVDWERLGGPAWFNRARYKAERAFVASGIVEDRSPGPRNKALRNRPPGREIFSLPYSWFNITEHPLVKEADVVHLHWVSYGMIDHATFFAGCEKPIIWTLHDMNPMTGGCHHADECVGFAEHCDVCPQLKDPTRARRYWADKRAGLDNVAPDRLHVVTPSRWLGEKAEHSALLKRFPRSVVSYGFDLNVMKPGDQAEARRAIGIQGDGTVIMFNALDVNNARKGMQFLLPALRSLARTDITLLALGHSAPPSMDGLTVHGMGYLTDMQRIAMCYSAADLFVLPSMAENFPNTICESLLCGTPVVAFNVGGIPEQVDQRCGVLVDRMDAFHLHAGLKQALGQAWDRRVIATEAATRYDRRRMVNAYRALYKG